MRRKKITKSNSDTNKEKDTNQFSLGKHKKIWGLFLIVFSLFISISIISYSPQDEDNLTNFFSDIKRDIQISLAKKNQEYIYLQARNEINNWMGSAGAHISRLFVKYSIGYFSLSIPIILLLLSSLLFRKSNLKKILSYSNLLLLISIFFSALFGILNTQFGLGEYTFLFSGEIGNFFGEFLGKTLGTIGSLLLMFFLMISFLVIFFDFKFELYLKKLFGYLANFIETSYKKIFGKKEIADNTKINIKTKSPVPEELNEKSAVEKNVSESQINETQEETRIRIIKKGEEPESELRIPSQEKSKKKETTIKISSDDQNVDEKSLPNQWEEKIEYKFPTVDLLDKTSEEEYEVAEDELKRNAQLLKDKLKLFDIDIKDISVTPGPVVTLYEIVPAPGVKISKIVALENDIALALAAKGIRIIAPIPGKSAIGVEIPNMKASLVTARSVLSQINNTNFELPLALGKTISGDVYVADLAKMPHLLIAGSTGSGKSVGINMIISSLLFTKHPSEIKFCLVDPKKIELSFYQKLKKHFLAISPDLDESIITTPQNAVVLLKAVEFEMNKRYDRLSNAGVRNIVDYNKKVSNSKTKPSDTETIKHHPLPYIIVIVDELADLMLTSGREVEEPITRLAQMARAVGIHLILATQRPSVNVITGVIKANFSARMAYQVATKIDSRTILDMNGAEQLLGSGDMLFLPTGSPKPIRIQNAFISTDEVEKITNYIYSQPAFSKPYYLPSLQEVKQTSSGRLMDDIDPMLEDAAKIVVRFQQGSVSLLQRKLKLGYSRAARIMDQLEEAGIVGPNDGSKARIVLVDNEETLETILKNL
ncbi:MAG: DNA translocase FtsK [Ignavibacterium sp.]|nr:DNA translocase FtsK [Ignavibacterium sp.]MCX7612070.1 DNA translocase FtsK [Ignavibacterium sp.]MDW8375288.1 DNA translocase FtsK 4TM domain-containing protein [Ignavibacteriales bacterium]